MLLLAQLQLAWQFEGVGQRQAHRHRREHGREDFEGNTHGGLSMPERLDLPQVLECLRIP